MAKAKAKEIKEAPVLRSGGGGGGDYEEAPMIDRIIVKGKYCIADLSLDIDIGKIKGYVEIEGEQYAVDALIGD